MRNMNIFIANMKSRFLFLFIPSFVLMSAFYFSYLIRMKEYERNRRLDDRAAKQAKAAE